MMQKDIYKIPMGYALRGRQMQVGSEKIAFFDRSRSLRLRRLTAENLCPSATVLRDHDDAVRWRKNTQCHQQLWWQSKSDNHGYGPVHINEVDCTEVC